MTVADLIKALQRQGPEAQVEVLVKASFGGGSYVGKPENVVDVDGGRVRIW